MSSSLAAHTLCLGVIQLKYKRPNYFSSLSDFWHGLISPSKPTPKPLMDNATGIKCCLGNLTTLSPARGRPGQAAKLPSGHEGLVRNPPAGCMESGMPLLTAPRKPNPTLQYIGIRCFSVLYAKYCPSPSWDPLFSFFNQLPKCHQCLLFHDMWKDVSGRNDRSPGADEPGSSLEKWRAPRMLCPLQEDPLRGISSKYSHINLPLKFR